MISTDRLIFDEKSDVRARQIEYAKDWGEVHIIIFDKSKLLTFAKYELPPSLRLRRTSRRASKTQIVQTQIGPNCWVCSTESFSKFMYPFDAIKIGGQIIKQHGITEITCQDASLTAMVGVSLKKKFKIPLEIQIHEDLGSPNYAFNLTNRIRRMLAKRYISRVDKIRVVSERIKRYVESVGAASRFNREVRPPVIEIRPIKVDSEKIKNTPVTANLRQKYSQFSKIVLMASRLEKEKNIGLAIKAWPIVLQSFPKAGLIIVGDGSQKSNLQFQISEIPNISSTIVFEGHVDMETLISYYKTTDLFLNTSLFEGYGMTLVEAQAAGCRIISTDVGVAREVGATIIEFNADDVASKITKIFQS
ncbi:MAG: glycosyltransferase family 4 protein [Candidatus Taylorbacteria bacterium]|nr:glycosyltransferase family 4 protein [Candidatus Taylorbacteria bacterium]